jgi:hypothetical protein
VAAIRKPHGRGLAAAPVAGRHARRALASLTLGLALGLPPAAQAEDPFDTAAFDAAAGVQGSGAQSAGDQAGGDHAGGDQAGGGAAWTQAARTEYLVTKLLAVDALEKGRKTLLANEGISTARIADYTFSKAFLEEKSR